MNSFSKNKGLIIELTSLLDVIMIMLFWIMNCSAGKADEAQMKAEREIAEANSRAEEFIEKKSSQFENIDEYISAVEGFEDGEMLSICIKSGEKGDELCFSRKGKQIMSCKLSSYSDVDKEIKHVLDDLPKKDEIILAAFIYDGSSALYRNVESVRTSLEKMQKDYDNVYFSYVNTGS